MYYLKMFIQLQVIVISTLKIIVFIYILNLPSFTINKNFLVYFC